MHVNSLPVSRKFHREKVAPILEFSSRKRLDIVVDIAKGAKVLDMGCVGHEAPEKEGDEWSLHSRLLRAASSVKGLDYDREGVEAMCKMGYDVVAADAENFDLGEKFDMVVAGEFVEHITNHRGFLNSVRGCLNDGGKLVLTTPNSNGLFYFASTLVFGHEIDGIGDHTCMFTPLTISVMLRKCGFRPTRIILCQPFAMYNHKSLLMRAVATMGNIVYRAACILRRGYASKLIVVAEPELEPGREQGAQPAAI